MTTVIRGTAVCPHCGDEKKFAVKEEEKPPIYAAHCGKCGDIYTFTPSRESHWIAGKKSPSQSAHDLLDKAARHMQDRADTYDKAEGERSMTRAVAAFNSITGRALTEAEGYLLIQVLKDVRLFTSPGYHADSAEDCIAYAALKAEAKCTEVAHG